MELYSSNNCKLVQFINYFCGDCRRFAATFKQLAWKLYGWRTVLSIFVVDCAQERNVQICRDFDIQKTPTLRIFPPDFQRTEKQVGFDLDTLVPDAIFAKLAEYISKVKYTMLGQPDFKPVKATDIIQPLLQKLGCFNSSAINFTVLVYQPEGSTIGRDTILGLLIWPMVNVRILSDRRLFRYFVLSPTNSTLALMDCVGNAKALQPLNDTSASYVACVGNYIHSLGYALPLLPTNPAPNITNYLIDEEQAAILSTVLQGRSKVYRADLEQAIDQLIHIELPKVRIFKGDNMMALRQFLNVLCLFSPLNVSGKLLLQRLYEFVNGSTSGELTGMAFQAQVQLLEGMQPKVFKARRYVGCIASGPFLRGFTCSLWTLFHYFTVQASKSLILPAGFVLGTVHGFVKHFFGCRDCVQHFMGMSERRKIFSVASRDEEILWLWEAHNEVNQRLEGDITEDPKFPKVQFPTLSVCGNCQINSLHNTTWQRPQVLSFLKELYDGRNLSNYGLPTTNGYN
ncbi:sulfhydryl oxidase 1 [Drosophila grimshawi]|nr:sulfhydryl oxidase 1 [Drosophila grimshawi]